MDEDLMHVLISCSHAKRFWDETLTCLDVIFILRYHKRTLEHGHKILCVTMVHGSRHVVNLEFMKQTKA
jgi:hypothetical protein